MRDGREYNLKSLQNAILRYDVGVDANNMAPVSAKEIIDFFGQQCSERFIEQ